MKIIVGLIAGVLFAGNAIARIGETMAECEARYGKLSATENGAHTAVFSGFLVFLQFGENGKCNLIGFSKMQKDALGMAVAMSDTEKSVLLDSNIGKAKYAKQFSGINETYMSSDGSVSGQYDTVKNLLIIVTTDTLKQEAEKQKASEQKAMGGF